MELDYVRQGVSPTVGMVRDAIRERMAPGASLKDFIRGMMEAGRRKIETTAIYGERDRNTLEAQLKNNYD